MESQINIYNNSFIAEQNEEGEYEEDEQFYLPDNGDELILYIATHIEDSERFLEFFEVFKDCFMPPEFYNEGPYDYNDTEILRVQQIIQNVIKTTDSKETMLIKKREIRMIGDEFKEERREKIKYIKLIAMPPNSHPVTRFM